MVEQVREEDAAKEYAFEREVRGRLRPPIVFFHIPKCAGTSILEYIRRHYPKNHVLADLDIERTLAQFIAERPARGWAYVGHIDFQHYRQITFPHISFSVFRDPHQRLASRYFSLRDQTVELAWPLLNLPRTKTFEQWLAILSDRDASRVLTGSGGLDGLYYFGEILRYMIGRPRFVELTKGELDEKQALAEALVNLSAFDFCLITEDLARGRSIIGAALGITDTATIRNINHSTSSSSRKDSGTYQFTEQELKHLDFLCRLEMPIYEAAKQIYASYFGDAV